MRESSLQTDQQEPTSETGRDLYGNKEVTGNWTESLIYTAVAGEHSGTGLGAHDLLSNKIILPSE